MARFYNTIGFGLSVETPEGSGIWDDIILERKYKGDIIKDNRQRTPTENLHDNISVGNSVSIIADTMAIDNFMHIRYINWSGRLWTVARVELKAPRLILDLGGLYNGPTATT